MRRNTWDTSLSPRSAEQPASLSPRSAEQPAIQEAEARSSRAPKPGEVPEGWTAYEDPGSGQIYYWCDETEEVEWEIKNVRAKVASYAKALLLAYIVSFAQSRYSILPAYLEKPAYMRTACESVS